MSTVTPMTNTPSFSLRALPWLTLASALVCIAAFSGLLPRELAFVLKPLTTVLVIAWACPRGHSNPRMRRLVLIGLVLSLVGDVALLWPRQGFLPGLVAFLLAHLAYIAAFCVPARLASKPWVVAVYGVIATALLAVLWHDVPGALRAPVVAYVACLALMAAQAAVWWRHAPRDEHAQRAAVGGVLFMASDTLLAFNKFSLPLPASALLILGTYWVAQWCIASALPRAGVSTSGSERPPA